LNLTPFFDKAYKLAFVCITSFILSIGAHIVLATAAENPPMKKSNINPLNPPIY